MIKALHVLGKSRTLTFYFFISLFLFIHETGRCQIKINEVLAANTTFNYDTQFYNFSSWIELYNSSASTLNIGGCYLTDSKTNLTKWAIPANTTIAANSYLTIWCDKKDSMLHTNFEIDTDGEGLFLYTNILTLLDSITLPKQYSNVSYGRLSNGATWGYLLKPTPSAENGSSALVGQLSLPIFSVPSGRFASSVSLTLTHPFALAQIRYTIDGSEPTDQSALYSSAIAISQTTIVKAKAFTLFSIPSETVTRTYFINEHAFTIPVVSISMNPAFLTDNTIGIYVVGTNGIAGNCVGVTNVNQDWGRYCVVEYFTPSGNSEFKKDFETKIYGACSRNFSGQKSLAFYARNEFGKGHLEYQLFSSKKIDKFDSFVLRNSGNDFNVLQCKDGLIQEIIRTSFDIDWQAYQPTAVYLNGAYWGIMNLREKLNENYVEHNAKVDADSIDFLETELRTEDSNVILGSNDDYLAFKNNLQSMNLLEDAAFDYINSQIDVTECINYYIAEIYFKNTDWPGNNIKLWKPAKQGGKWRWIIFDTDFGFNDPTHTTLNFATNTAYVGDNWPNPDWSTLLFRLLITNPTFKQRFIQTFQTAISTSFNPTRINNFIDSVTGLIATEMVYHKAKWGGTINDWNYNVSVVLKTFAQQRYAFMPGHIKSFFNITDPMATFVTNVLQPGTGSISLNNIVSSETNTVQLYQNMPYSISAIPASGYAFKQWKIKTIKNLIIRGDTWKYHDLGTDLGTAWTSESYSDASWTSGPAELGYGEYDEATTINYGGNTSNKYITYYCRKNITIADTSNISSVSLNLMCDDGAVIYINGTEALRFNMPAGTINNTTLATVADAIAEKTYQIFSLDPKLLKPGNNCVAVEIHQCNITSSDVSFDMDLQIIKNNTSTSTTQTINDTVKDNKFFTAEFEIKTPVSNLVINEIAPVKSNVTDNYGNADDWFELYNSGSDTINLTGLLLTDNFLRKNKFEIWNNSTSDMKLAPKEFKIFWADEQEYQGNNHIPFKLSGTSERIGLFQIIGTDTLAIDTITYGLQKDLFTWGRYPDGATAFQFLSCITPEYSNTTICVPDAIMALSDNTQIKVYPNPASEYLTIELPDNTHNATYTIFNQLGKPVLSGNITNQPINCNNLSTGVYLLIIHTESNRISHKIMISR